jgi:long-chain acyl-CoA synthetase
MFVGGRLYTMESFRRREVLNILAQDRITYFGGVPYMFLILAETVPTTEVDLSHLRVVFSASAPLVAKDNNAFHSRYGIYVRQLYGSTETGTISVNLGANIQNCLESVGTPLTGIHVKVHNENGRFADVGEEGEIVIASPAAIRAYEGNESATRGSFRDGYYLSGDLGRMDCDGNLWLTGRKALLINRGGFKVNPFEVEKAIRSYEKVRDVVVLGTPSRHGDDIVRCIVVPAGRCTAQEIIHHCEDLIADYKIPTQIEFRTELPRSSTGKLLRHGL